MTSAKKNCAQKVHPSFENEEDIIQVLKADHEPLKRMIKVMKELENSLSERRAAFILLEPLLLSHAKAGVVVL